MPVLGKGDWRRGLEFTLIAAVDHSPHGRRMLAQNRLLTSRQIQPAIRARQHTARGTNGVLTPRRRTTKRGALLPQNLPVHARAKGLVRILAKAHVQHGRAMLEAAHQLALAILALDIVQVHVSIPGCCEELRRALGAGGEGEGGYRVGGRRRELVLNC